MRHVVLIFSLVFLILPISAHADQLQCNSEKDAKRAAEILRRGTLMLDFCSMCEDDVQVVNVEEARVVQDCNFEVRVTGAVIARSSETYRESYPADARYDLVNEPYQQQIDLAYAYVETASNVFTWLGGVLKLKAEVKVRTLSLPPEIYAQLGQHNGFTRPAQDKLQPVERSAKLTSLGFDWFDTSGVRDVVKAFDSGSNEASSAAADKLLDSLIAQTLGTSGIKGAPATSALREIINLAYKNRLSYPTAPLRFVMVGRDLLFVEKLPLAKLEQVMAALAVWAGAKAFVGGQETYLEGIANALLFDPTTLADLYRRTPRASALAQFYALLYLRTLGTSRNLSPDGRIVGTRLKQYFDDEKGAFKGNYSAVLGKLLK